MRKLTLEDNKTIFKNFVRSNNNKSFNYCDRGIKINPKRLLWDNRKS